MDIFAERSKYIVFTDARTFANGTGLHPSLYLTAKKRETENAGLTFSQSEAPNAFKTHIRFNCSVVGRQENTLNLSFCNLF